MIVSLPCASGADEVVWGRVRGLVDRHRVEEARQVDPGENGVPYRNPRP